MTLELHELNGQRAILCDRDNKGVGTLTIEVLGGQIQTIRSVIKPNKLKHVDPVATPGRSSENSAGSPAHGLTGRADCAPDM